MTSYLPYGRSKNTPSLTSAGGWSKYSTSGGGGGMTSTPKSKPSSSTVVTQPSSTSSVYQSHPPSSSTTTSGYPSFSSYAHRQARQPLPPGAVTVSGAGAAVATASGSRALKRTGIASSYGSLTGIIYASP
jgi:hypothetical protein